MSLMSFGRLVAASRTWSGRFAARLLPFWMIAAGIVFQLVTPAQLNGSPFLIVAPLMAAPLFTLWQTVAVGAAALASAAVLQLVEGIWWERFDQESMTRQLTSIAFATVMAVVLNVVVRRERERFISAREVAEAAQRAVVPTPPPLVAGLQVAARYEAARDDALIGGDLYDARSTAHGARLVIGDVMGKGIKAIETVSVVLGAFREASHQERTLLGVARRLEEALARDIKDPGTGDAAEVFVTCVLMEVSGDHRLVHVLNCGHPAPLLLDGDGDVTPLAPSTFRLPLGLSDMVRDPSPPDVWEFPRGSTLLLYTDGLSEARDTTGTFYDPAQALPGLTYSTPEHLLSALSEDVRRFSGTETTDDMALLAAHRP
ncbi:serine/threonine-protein phosphatase [Streptomyces anulatus]|uniref:Serine/threonine-protein phosphatase n=1 Tax=Streptomyces anulatus TaxID=1892 RepID=A0A6G3T1L3_STRAQ|nr:PP2C family protein-serine/threonine phosphatase [Streptomyces anulatus]NEB89030.1 serine/threonine-protein phosphatase [Streptomyces anulatus]